MKKELTKEELKEYVKKHGETEVEFAEDYGTKEKGCRASLRLDGDGDLICSDGFCYNRYKGNFIVLDYKETGFLADEYEWLEVGDLVDVHKSHKTLAYEKGLEIKEVAITEGGYRVYTRNKVDYWWVSALHVKPHIPEEKTEEMTAEQGLIEVIKNSGYKIVKE